MFKIEFTIPWWLHWIIPKKIRKDLDQRKKLTGKSSRQWEWFK